MNNIFSVFYLSFLYVIQVTNLGSEKYILFYVVATVFFSWRFHKNADRYYSYYVCDSYINQW